MISLLAGNLKNSSINSALPFESKDIKVSINVISDKMLCFTRFLSFSQLFV